VAGLGLAWRGAAWHGKVGQGMVVVTKEDVMDKGIERYDVTLTGQTPLLMHADNIEWADRMEEWGKDPANKKWSKAGDDRTPAFRWLGCLYHDGEHVAIPADNISRCVMEAGAMVPVKGNKTFKSQTQSGMVSEEQFWTFLANGAQVPIKPLFELQDETVFSKHSEFTQKTFGFWLFVKRAKIGQSKHIRVRPRFDQWTAHGTIRVWDKQITESTLATILQYAGAYKGLCDWRSGAKTPGQFGRFTVEVKKLK